MKENVPVSVKLTFPGISSPALPPEGKMLPPVSASVIISTTSSSSDPNAVTVFAQVKESVGKSAEFVGIAKVIPSQVSRSSEVTGNIKGAAVGSGNSHVPVHVKVAVYESARALGAPVAANSIARIIHKCFVIFKISPASD